MNLRRFAFALLALTGSAIAETGLLYHTDFQEFLPGENQWAGHHDWFSNSEALSTGVQGIDDQIIFGLGKSAYLGFNQPSTGWNYVARQIKHDPLTENSARIEIETLLGVQDSTNDHYDSFFVTIYNDLGEFLAAIQFSNEQKAYGIWRDDGIAVTDTTVDFLTGEVQLLVLQIDLVNNLWSAEYDGIPLFKDQIFTRTESQRVLGLLAYEWQITDSDPANHGDNWLLVADCSVWAIPHGSPKISLSQPTISPEGNPVFHFTGEPGWTYQIEYSDTFSDWFDDLPDSRFLVTGVSQNLQFTDSTSQTKSARFYRITRVVTP